MDYLKFRLRCFSTVHTKYYMFCGSTRELPKIYREENPTDMDVMFYYCDICAIPWNRNPPKKFRGTLLRIDSRETPPGFVKLQINQGKTQDKTRYYRRPRMLTDAKSFGPAVQYYVNNTQKTCELSCDLVYAVYCPYWPLEAEEWKVRHRCSGWPSEKLIARITKGGCHLVSKLRTWSTCDDTEWRFSFSKAELILIHSWTNVQKHVYHVLRLIKKEISKKFGDDKNVSLQTYHFKTIMFWACERKMFWSEDNIDDCVSRIIANLLECLMERRCSHYFIPQINIMSHLEDRILDEELNILLKYMENGTLRYYKPNAVPPFVNSCTMSLEYFLLGKFPLLFPLNEELNGRLGQYLSQCDWFLPGMKYLHRAIEANLCLMSLDNVTVRKESEYFSLCLDNLGFASIRSEDFHMSNISNFELSPCENINVILRRKQLRKGFAVYRRLFQEPECDASDIYFPSLLECVATVYRANFYFSAMKSYFKCQSECVEGLRLFKKSTTTLLKENVKEFYQIDIPVLLSNGLSPIFDEHLQVILGFVTLHKYLSCYECQNSKSSVEVCLKLNSSNFLNYLSMQCFYKISGMSRPNFYCYSQHLDWEPLCMSKLIENDTFGGFVLNAALRQSKAYEKSMVFTQNPDRGSFHFLVQIKGSSIS